MRKRTNRHQITCPSGVYWIIDKGDTLYLISRKLNIPLEKLLSVNPGVNPENLQVGDKICIPF